MAMRTMVGPDGQAIVVEVPDTEQPGDGAVVARRSRISWGAIFAGVIAALSIWGLLYALGLALGLSAVDPNDPASIKPSGVFTGIWSLIVPLVALFIGGMVASRAADARDRGTGALHGFVMWGLTTLLGAWFITALIGMVVGGMASMGKAAVQAGGSAAAGLASQAGQVGGVATSFGIDADDALQPVNQRLVAEGKPAITADQLRAATKDAVQDAVRQGRMDRQLLVNSIAQQTALSRNDAEELATRIETQFKDARARLGDRLSDAAQAAQSGALKAADATGKAFWGIFGAMLLGLIAAVGGAVVSAVRSERREQRTLATAETRAPRAGTPILRPEPEAR